MKNGSRKLLSIFLIFSMIFTLVPAVQISASAAWDGSGKNISWYVRDASATVFYICDENDLAGLAALVNAGTSGTVTYDSGTGMTAASGTTIAGNDFSGRTVILTTDLDLGGTADWTPIGTDASRFLGTFNGCGCTVSGIKVSASPSSGLFGCIGVGGTVRNLAASGTVSGVYGRGFNAGGIAGTNYGIVQNCFSACTIDVSGQFNSSFGGVVGYNKGSLKNCGNTDTATITATDGGVNAGGVVGENNTGTVQNCYNTGNLSMDGGGYGYQYVGGVSGDQYLGALQNCYNTGTVTMTNTGIGSFSGGVEGHSMGTVSNCYWNISAGSGIGYGGRTGIFSFDAGGALSTAVTINGVDYTSLQDALNAWVGSGTNSRSFCYWNRPVSSPAFYTNWSEVVGYTESGIDYSQNGTDYTVSTALGLAYVGSLVTAGIQPVNSVTLTGNIDLSLYEWTPIGTDTNRFTGTFDGGNFDAQNLYLNTGADRQGLFSCVGNDGLVKNLELTDCSVIGANTCGGMIGDLYGTAQNCHVTGVICCSTSCDGGIAADVHIGGVIRLCSADVIVIDHGTLSAGSGGIAGVLQGTLQDCFSSGYVTSGEASGGIVGLSFNGTVKNCYVTGTVSGTSAVGRVAGYADTSTVQNCYYLTIAGVAANGIGTSSAAVLSETTAKTAAELSTAEMAWILNTTNGTATNSGVWAQGTAPIFMDATHLAVYRATLVNSASPTVVYSNSSGAVTLPSTPTGTTSETFLGWYRDSAFASAYTAPAVLSQDMMIYGDFGVRIITAGHYSANYTGSPVAYAGTVTDNACLVPSVNPLIYTYYTDSAGTIETTAANSGTASDGAAPIWAGIYYVLVHAAASATIPDSTPALAQMRIIDNTDHTDYYSVTTVQSDGGTISQSSKSVAEGQSVTFSITPEKGYEIADVLVNGVSVGAVATYTVKNVVSDTTVNAVFKKIWSNPFQDVSEQAWYYESVRFASANGLFNGTAPDTFNPEGSMTRGMFVTVLYRLSGNNGSTANTFIDVPSGAWYEQAAAWAYASGISGGVGNNRFAPDTGVTREQLVLMLYNYAKYKGYDVSVGEDTNILSYGDALSISEYVYPALQWACGAGIIGGDDNGNLNPRSCATRAEVAAILQRFIENVAG